MTTIPLAQLREQLGETISRTTHNKTRTTITRHGKPAAAIVPIEDIEHLEKIEDELDSLALKKAINNDDGYRITLEDLLKEIN